MLIGVAQRRLVIARRGSRWLLSRLAGGPTLGPGLSRLILGSLLFTFFHAGSVPAGGGG
jgi:hypothetical protein